MDRYLYTDAHEAIISDEMFMAVEQEKLSRSKEPQNHVICHGNICHNPMAEFVMKNLMKKAGLTSQFQIALAATSQEEIGNPVYPLARRKLAEHGISCSGHAARQLTNSDYEEYDLLIGMDKVNLRDMYRICGGDFADKIHFLMDFTDHSSDVADPRGTPTISRQPGRMYWQAAKDCLDM